MLECHEKIKIEQDIIAIKSEEIIKWEEKWSGKEEEKDSNSVQYKEIIKDLKSQINEKEKKIILLTNQMEGDIFFQENNMIKSEIEKEEEEEEGKNILNILPKKSNQKILSVVIPDESINLEEIKTENTTIKNKNIISDKIISVNTDNTDFKPLQGLISQNENKNENGNKNNNKNESNNENENENNFNSIPLTMNKSKKEKNVPKSVLQTQVRVELIFHFSFFIFYRDVVI